MMIGFGSPRFFKEERSDQMKSKNGVKVLSIGYLKERQKKATVFAANTVLSLAVNVTLVSSAPGVMFRLTGRGGQYDY